MGWYLGQRTFPFSSEVQFLCALDFKGIAPWGVKQVGMGLVTQIHWSHGYFSIAVRSVCGYWLIHVCEHFSTFAGVFFWQWTVQIEARNHLQNFHVRTSKSHFEHLCMHRHTHLNTFNAHTNITEIDFCLQCSVNPRELCKSVKEPGNVAPSPVMSWRSNSAIVQWVQTSVQP